MRLDQSFVSLVKNELGEMEDLMRAQTENYRPELSVALDLLLSSGGKRVRPTIVLLVGRMLGVRKQALLTLAAAVELLHSATLVHDDLIDQSLIRRGMPTINSQWSTGATVLAGDFLFSSSAKLVSEIESVSLMKVFARTLTTIVNGELTQLFGKGYQANRNNYYDRIYAKTASLFETSALIPAMLSGFGDNIIERMGLFGHEIGMAFQIMDDIFDFTGAQETLGKPVGNDLRQGLVTLPAIIYFETHLNDPDVAEIQQSPLTPDEALLNRLVEAIKNSEAVDLAYLEAKEFVRHGIDCLSVLPESDERQALEDLSLYFVRREL